MFSFSPLFLVISLITKAWRVELSVLGLEYRHSYSVGLFSSLQILLILHRFTMQLLKKCTFLMKYRSAFHDCLGYYRLFSWLLVPSVVICVFLHKKISYINYRDNTRQAMKRDYIPLQSKMNAETSNQDYQLHLYIFLSFSWRFTDPKETSSWIITSPLDHSLVIFRMLTLQ